MLNDKIFRLYDRKPGILGHDNLFKSAVMVPLVKNDSEWSILFQKRSSHINRQPGEISFPGGAIEASDEGPRFAAIRECCEELGLEPHDIGFIADLDIFVSPFNMLITPCIGYIHHPEKIKLDPAEVERIFYVPLQWLLDYEPLITSNGLTMHWAEDFPVDMIPYGKNYPYRKMLYPQHIYIWENEIIWGLTARILTHFLDLIR